MTPTKISSNFPLLQNNDYPVRSFSIQKHATKSAYKPRVRGLESLGISINAHPINNLSLSNSLLSSPQNILNEATDYTQANIGKLDNFISNTKSSPMKYYKDKPRIRLGLKFPKDVFK